VHQCTEGTRNQIDAVNYYKHSAFVLTLLSAGINLIWLGFRIFKAATKVSFDFERILDVLDRVVKFISAIGKFLSAARNLFNWSWLGSAADWVAFASNAVSAVYSAFKAVNTGGFWASVAKMTVMTLWWGVEGLFAGDGGLFLQFGFQMLTSYVENHLSIVADQGIDAISNALLAAANLANNKASSIGSLSVADYCAKYHNCG
jgi:hypothetical protein